MIDYTGFITLGCQEGGYAYPTIELNNMKIEAKSLLSRGHCVPMILSELIEKEFKGKKVEDGSGDVKYPELRIRIEEIK